MNEQLMNPLGTRAHPTAVQTSLYAGARKAKFDPSGRYIVADSYPTSVCIWDLETRTQVRRLDGHVRFGRIPFITDLDWSRNSRYVLTAGQDWNVNIWDLASEIEPQQRLATLRFDNEVISASFHPRNSKIILVVLREGEAYLVDRRQKPQERTELEENNDERIEITCAKFDATGRYVFAGTHLGSVLVFNTRTKKMIARYRLPNSGIARGLAFSSNGRRFLTINSDRYIRCFNVPSFPPSEASIESDLEPTYRFHDPVNKNAWLAVAFSPSGEWVAGGADDSASHKIFIWDLNNDGRLTVTLDGGKETLSHLHWHPKLARIASCTKLGNILLWHNPTPERWGAYAADYEEVDVNVEYEEREDEFDMPDAEEMKRRKEEAEQVDVDVDEMPEQAYVPPAQVDDEDTQWAEQNPDNDDKPFTLKVHIQEDAVLNNDI
ncbi:COMPASS complex protein [Cylindrobasidium torrendii FP15055 ss-10]|uniref:COMPASS complex protein n=1 Tax=Cylindrobasidium torrendii FP15055 ss-10 TaxID=1314674 RepID=A0A0D7B703_9AGAR|nr:COMPASS complex protein [Cylindrobasidium torrendii FP15055 ss-10]